MAFGQLDPDGGFARDRGDDAHAHGLHRQSNIVGEARHRLHFDARGGREIKPGDDRAGMDFHDFPLHAEIGERFFQMLRARQKIFFLGHHGMAVPGGQKLDRRPLKGTDGQIILIGIRLCVRG